MIIIGNEEKKFSIYMEPHVGQIAQEFFSNEKPERPQTFDFLDRTFLGLNIKVLRVLIYDLKETTYFSKILYEQEIGGMTHLIEVDARPSDALVLALRHHAPIFCSRDVLEQTIPYVDVEEEV
ncbi:MAG: hypothetical protein S4CHLAM6_06140 [Chlamydiae bacterium]|nr:hypothetical protein [Chlamydiota bacterium]